MLRTIVLQVLDDLVNVLDDGRNGLVFVHDATDPECPYTAAPRKRGKKHPADRIAERMPEPALERLQDEVGGAPSSETCGDLDALREYETGKIDVQIHLFFPLNLS